MRKHIILFLAANPSGTTELALAREAMTIGEELQRYGQGGNFEFRTRQVTQPLDLLRVIRDVKPTVVHFAWYRGSRDVSDPRHGLHFHRPDGEVKPVSPTTLTETFAAIGSFVKLVVLSACYTQPYAEALRAHVDCVVGTGSWMGDDAAMAFAVGFYGALGDRQPIGAAVSQGCAAVSLEGLPIVERPALWTRNGVDASRLVLGEDHDTNIVPSQTRDIVADGKSPDSSSTVGRNLIAVVGVDRYQRWPPLSNAVNDARGSLVLFEQLGFEPAAPPLLDNAATGGAIQSLVTDDLLMVGPDDSLVLFYAGHGGNRKHRVGDREITTGYLIPVDAAEDRASTWVDLEAWLRFVALLPAKHILVILDACHSGIALDPVIKWRSTATHSEPLSALGARRSRRIITSALGDQRAMDGGPRPGHSLFTGCLIEALTDGLHRSDKLIMTGSELGLYMQQRVGSYPQSQQTPDFGAFAFDARGEMILSLALDRSEHRRTPPLAASTMPASSPPYDDEEDRDGSAELATSNAGSNVIDRDDQTLFWTDVEQLLDPPTTVRGARAQRPQSYRHGAFAGNVRLGVVANANGAMRVHLWSTHHKHQDTLRAIEHEVLAGSIAIPTQLPAIKTRPAPHGEMLYLEFAWHRSGTYRREIDRVKASIDWFVSMARNQFK